MNFAEKLDLLMHITNTSNSLLARNLTLDASVISRLRRGVRTPAKNATYLEKMSEYFARSCPAEYQIVAVREAIKKSMPTNPPTAENLANLIYWWLREEPASKTTSINNFLDRIINFQSKKMGPSLAKNTICQDWSTLGEVETYYGVEGKQKAVLTFLSLVLQNPDPQTLLLYSDEDQGWLTDNPAYTARWAELLLQVIKKGHRIKIIHSLNRDFDEMLTAVTNWVPVYMTGAIEPYYYPKTRDGLFHRTLFLAPDTAAVTATSVRSCTNHATNFLFTNKDTIRALIEEYNDFLNHCRPLMQIFNAHSLNDANYLDTLIEFEKEAGNMIAKTNAPANITLPPEVASRVLDIIDDSTDKLLRSYQQQRIITFKNHLKKHSFIEIFPLPDLETVLAGKAMVNLAVLPSKAPVFYTPQEYSQHLQNLIQLLKTQVNYQLYLVNDKHLEGSVIYVKEDVGVLVVKTTPPSTVFAINNIPLTAAFWDYMHMLFQKMPKGKIDRNYTIAELESFVYNLQSSC